MSQPPYPPYPGSPIPDPYGQQPGQPHPTEPYPAQPQSPAAYPGYAPPPGYGPPQPSGYPPPDPYAQPGGGYGQPSGYPQPDPYAQPGGGYAQPGQPSGYPQPDPYAQPGGGWGQPAAGFPGPAGFPPATPAPRKSNVGKIIAIVLVSVLVLCGGGVAAAYFLFKDEVAGVVEATDTRLVAPETLNGRPRITDPELQTVAESMVTGMRGSVPGSTSTIAAFYGDPARRDMVMIAGASGVIADPERELNAAITGLGIGGLRVTNATAIDPGPLGGVAKCGDASTSGVDLGVCVWADHGSLGVIAIYFKDARQAEAEFVQIRGEVEKR